MKEATRIQYLTYAQVRRQVCIILGIVLVGLLAAFIFSFAFYLSSTPARAEAIQVNTTGYFTATGSITSTTFPPANTSGTAAVRYVTNWFCCDNAVADDGSFFFLSRDKTLVAEDIGTQQRVFYYDAAANKLKAVPKLDGSDQTHATLARDKSWAVITTSGTGSSAGKFLNFFYNPKTGESEQLLYSNGNPVETDNLPQFTSDGNTIAFYSWKLDLVPEDTNTEGDVYTWNRTTKQLSLVSKGLDGAAATGTQVTISGDGRKAIFFTTQPGKYITGGCGNGWDFIQKDLTNGAYQCVTNRFAHPGEDRFTHLTMSEDGNTVLYTSEVYQGNWTPYKYYAVDLNGAQNPIYTLSADEGTAQQLTGDGKTVIYYKPQQTGYCLHSLVTQKDECILRNVNATAFNFYIANASKDAQFLVLNTPYHSLIGSVLEADRTVASNELYLWNRQGISHVVTGTVTADDGVTGLAGVYLKANTQEVYETDASGVFTVPFLMAGRTYVLTPTQSGTVFYPGSEAFTVPVARRLEFTTKASFTVSGTVTDSKGQGIAGALVSNQHITATTASDGSYTLKRVPPGENLLTVHLPGSKRKFLPAVKKVVLGPSQKDVNFTEKIPIILIPGTGASFNDECFIISDDLCSNTPTTRLAWSWMPSAAQYYLPLINQLNAAGFSETNGYFLVFHYDWRKPAETNAKLLAKHILFLRQLTDSTAVDIIAHSQGGLVTREYIQSDAFVSDVRNVFLAGTPNQGSPKTYYYWEGGATPLGESKWENLFVHVLLNQVYKTDAESTAEMFRRVFPSFQLMLTTYDYLERDNRSLPNAALVLPNTRLPLLNKDISRFFERARVYNFVGNGISTIQSLSVIATTPGSVQWPDGEVLLANKTTDGDGTVPLKSAQLSSAFSQTVVSGVHSEILESPEVQRAIFAALGLNPPGTAVVARAEVSAIEPNMLYIAISGTVEVTVTNSAGQSISQSGNTILGAEYVYKPGYPRQMVMIPEHSGNYTITVESTAASEYKLGVFTTEELDPTVQQDTFSLWSTTSTTSKPGASDSFTVTQEGTKLEKVAQEVEVSSKIYLPLVSR